MRSPAILLSLLLAPACATSDDGSGSDTPKGWQAGAGGVAGGGGVAAGGDGGKGGSGGGSGGALLACYRADGQQADGAKWQDAPHQAEVVVEQRDSCNRRYRLSSNQPLRDQLPNNPRTFDEAPGWPVVRSGHDLFDALYALALEETRENSVDAIVDGAFNKGQPVSCPPGGCFETGRLWRYVWTRDTAYASLLGLGFLDPARTRNSLAFKTSERRQGGDLQIVQDTGTGGSYPVSTDRATWAYGAWEVLKFLDGAARSEFRDLAYEAIVNTAEHDREVIFSADDGLYRGEQSFLDWREQSYPAWAADDLTQISMSKSLSTNAAHHQLLQVAAALAKEKGFTSAQSRYQGWADQLATAMADRFYVDELAGFSSFISTHLDSAPTRRLDLIGTALAVSAGIGSPAQRQSAIAAYPLLPKGPAALWPQQQSIPVYHNRGQWPFATALWLRAARSVKNHGALSHGVRSLMRGAALNLSNMENFEAVTGAPWFQDGAASGPVVNSQRQLWSVAGYVSMVHEVIFGLEASQEGIRFAPFLPGDLRDELFGASGQISLSGLRYKGRTISVVMDLANAGVAQGGALEVVSAKLNGQALGKEFISPAALRAENLIELQLGLSASGSASTTQVTTAALADYRNLYGPRTPEITNLQLNNSRLRISLDGASESAADIAFNIYRDGQPVAEGLPGNTTSWTDEGSGEHAARSYCYAIETYFLGSRNHSQRSAPSCYWGPGDARVQSLGAQTFANSGGTLVQAHGHFHYEGWGDESDTLSVAAFSPNASGTHYLKLLAGNGAGPVSTGVGCGVKLMEVFDGATLVASGWLTIPQLGSWDRWAGSSFLKAELDSQKSYRIVIREDARSINMSERSHFATYAGTGGESGRFNRVNIAEIQVLRVRER